MFFCEFCENSKNTFFHRTPPVALSECLILNCYEATLVKSAIQKSELKILNRDVIINRGVLKTLLKNLRWRFLLKKLTVFKRPILNA